MTKTIKIISKVSLGIALIAGSFVLANPAMAATFNSPAAFQTFRAANANQSQGTFNWTTSVSANPGETVAFIIFAQNTSNETAIDTRVRSILPSAAFSSATIFGEVFAQNAPSVSNGVNVNLSSSQTLTFVPGTVSITNLSGGSVPVSFGQSGSEIITNSGLRLGDIPPNEGRFVVFRAIVGNIQQQPPQPVGQVPTVITDPATNIDDDFNNNLCDDNFNFNDHHARLNGRVNPNGGNTQVWFEWGTTFSLGNTTQQKSIGSGTSFISVSEEIGNLAPNTTHFFRIVAQNQFGGPVRGSILSFITLQDQNQQFPSVTTEVADNIDNNSARLHGRVNPNGSNTTVFFEWGTSGSLGFTTQSKGVGSGNNFVNVDEEIQNLQANTQHFFRIVAQNQCGIARGQVITFTTAPQAGLAPTVTTLQATNITANSATLNASVNPNNANTDVRFEWGTTFSLGNTTASQSIGSGTTFVNVSTSISGLSPNTTIFFRAVATNQFGTTQGSILSFTTLGQQGQVPIVTTNQATNITQNSALLNGTVNPNNAFTTAFFEWGLSSSLGNRTPGQSVSSGNFSLNFSEFISNLPANQTIFFRAAASNQFGEGRGVVLSFITSPGFAQGLAPFVITNQATNVGQNSAVLNASVNPNGGNTTAFFEFGTSFALGFTTGFQNVSGGTFAQNISATAFNLTPGTTYFFRIVAQNEFGINRGSILSFTTLGRAQGNLPIVTTLPATFIFQNSALLNGSVNPNSSLTTAWFEWGRTSALGSRTNSISVGSGISASSISSALTGLSSNTTYFFRAVGQNAFGTTFGDTRSFTTQRIVTVPVTPTEPTIIERRIVVVGTPDVTLTPAVDNLNPRAGEELTLTVVYRNGGSTAINNAVLKIVLPSEVEFVVSNPQPNFSEGSSIRFDIGRVAPNSQGIVSVKVKINRSTDAGSALVFNTTLDFTDSRNQFQSVNAFLTVVVKEGAALGASIFGLLKSLFGNWLFDLLLGLVLGFGIYHFFVKGKDRELAS